MPPYDRKPDGSRYSADPKPIGHHRPGESAKPLPTHIPSRGAIEKVRFTDSHGCLRLQEDRRVILAKAWVVIVALLSGTVLLAYAGYDPHMDRIGTLLGLSALGFLFVLPAAIVFLIVVPWSRGVEVNPNEGVCRFWSSYLRFPIQSGRYSLNACRWTHQAQSIITRGQPQQSTAGCLIGLLGPIGSLISGIMALTDREPDQYHAGVHLVLWVEAREQLHFVVFDQPAASEFLQRVYQLRNPENRRN